MPGRFERHARSSWEWSAPGSRKDDLARAVNDDPARKSAPGRKDPSRCKGNRGGPHIPEIALRNPAWEDEYRNRCQWRPFWSWKAGEAVVGWHCEHVRHCSKCGLIFDSRIGREACPAYPDKAEQYAAAEREASEWNEHRRIREAEDPRRNAVIKGRQGYRRKRKDQAS